MYTQPATKENSSGSLKKKKRGEEKMVKRGKKELYRTIVPLYEF